ncbi:cytochrome P450 [Crepidotus variabilis]|uniref:Cytochrome P450 n=1 Tax=Crepidotus variabilis TaxID=179855 RepID=A0A9P6EAN1_9AGAR|nr:cytochrome P450 [Crepidotus variabilis]
MASSQSFLSAKLLDNLGGQPKWLKISVALVAVIVLRSISKYRNGVKAVAGIPGFRVPFFPLGMPGVMIPTSWWNPGYYFTWQWKTTNYTRFGNDTFSLVPFLVGPPTIYTATLEVARQSIGGGHKTSFAKADQFQPALLYWGMNLVAADKEVWRKHRRIVGPAFNNSVYEMVWKETLQLYRDMTAAEQWDGKQEIVVPVAQDITFKLALLVIGKCGFGFRFGWLDSPQSGGRKFSLQEALRIVADTNLQATLLPKWIRRYSPIKSFRDSYEAYEQMAQFMDQHVAQKKEEIQSKNSTEIGKDVLTLLVQANEQENSKLKMSKEELLGNVFILLFAGHETTGHTLAVTLAFLSLYPDIQEDAYQQVKSVIGNKEPNFEDCNKLDKVLAIFFESLRLFPSGHLLMREAWEDTVIQVPNPIGQEGTTSVPVPRGTQLIVDMVGVHYNPRYFPDPYEFKPSRWQDVGIDSETFTAFSIGPRACMGRKFATVESVCFLSCLLRDFEVHPLLNAGETKEQWRERVVDAIFVLTLGVKDVPLRFVRRL